MTSKFELLSEELYTQRVMDRMYFFRTKCKICVKTKLQRKRDCNILKGYNFPCCNVMENYINKKNREKSKQLLSELMMTLLNRHLEISK